MPPADKLATSQPAIDQHPIDQPWLRRTLWVVLSAYWLLIFILTHTPGADLPKVKINDKLEHFLAYGMLGGLLYLTGWAVNPRRPLRSLAIWVWCIGLAYGAIDEWLQALVGRDCELDDWLADASAITIAVLVLTAVRWALRRRQAAVGTGE